MTKAAQKRRERILSQGYENGRVMVSSLASELNVSEATIRRDLKVLADENHFALVHGGAVLPNRVDFSFQSKSTRQVEAKKIIGRLAAGLVADGDQIFLDSGTTCFQMAPFLRSRRGLFVIVNSARLVTELGGSPGIRIITLGGYHRSDRMDTIGPLATNTLNQLRGYLAFVGADGLSMDFGPTAADIDSADLYRLAVRNAREAILLADHTKFLTPSLCKIVDWDAISRVVTDQPPTREWVEFLASKSITIIHPGGLIEPPAAQGSQTNRTPQE